MSALSPYPAISLWSWGSTVGESFVVPGSVFPGLPLTMEGGGGMRFSEARTAFWLWDWRWCGGFCATQVAPGAIAVAVWALARRRREGKKRGVSSCLLIRLVSFLREPNEEKSESSESLRAPSFTFPAEDDEDGSCWGIFLGSKQNLPLCLALEQIWTKNQGGLWSWVRLQLRSEAGCTTLSGELKNWSSLLQDPNQSSHCRGQGCCMFVLVISLGPITGGSTKAKAETLKELKI